MQPLHLRLVPLCHQITPSSPSPPGPGRDSRFPDIWNFCCAISFGSRGESVHFPQMFWHWDVLNSSTGVSMCFIHLPDASSCAWPHFQKEELPGGSAVTARLCHIPCFSSLSSPGVPSSLPASVSLCPLQTVGHSPDGLSYNHIPKFPLSAQHQAWGKLFVSTGCSREGGRAPISPGVHHSSGCKKPVALPAHP